MSKLASGTVTFLYTDIEGSTRLWEQHPHLMASALDRHDDIWRDVVAGGNGQIFRVTGDGFCASFSHAGSAVTAAVTAQRALAAFDWGPIGRLRVRAIVHTGVAEVRNGDYVGGSLNIAGRLLSVCHGGQTLLSPTTADLVRQQLPAGTDLLNLGRHRFRDIADALLIYQLAVDGLENDFPPLSSLEDIPHNLPEQLTSFIGREQEMGEVRRLLGENRLITLVGPGGTGKTRLSIEVARQVKEAFPDGAWLVQLAAISDPALVDQNIASVLGVQEQPGRSMLESLTTYLRRKQLLLLLDNCEHLVDACAKTAAALLQSCPELQILASSREGLGIPGESVYPLHPLSLPKEGDTLQDIAEYDAVRLFLERSQLARPDITLSPSNASAVSQICRRLDGIPLAIELAAARTKQLSPEQIASRLDQSFRLLTGGSRAALPRQQTLRALIDWSYELLSTSERILFRRLSVFHGGWTLDAAEAVCAQGQDESTCLDPFDIMDLNGSLVEKSMIELDHKSGEPRYRLLETMRQFGLEKLKEAGEALIIRNNHLAYYTALAVEGEFPILRREDVAAVDRLDADHDNLTAALEWASNGDQETLINLAAALGPFWSATGYVSEGRFWLDLALDNVDVTSAVADRAQTADRLAQAFFFQGLMAFVQGSNQSALAALDKSLQVARQENNPYFAAQSLALRSPALMSQGRLDEALASAQEGNTIAQELGDDLVLSRTTSAVGGIMLAMDLDPDTGWGYLEESIKRSRQANDMGFLTTPLLVMTEFAVAKGRLDLAWESVQEGMEVVNALRNNSIRQNFSTKAADVYRLRGEYAEAIPIYQQAVTTWREVGNLGAMARCIECLAYIETGRAGRFSAARREQALVRASQLFGAAEAIRESPEAAMHYLEHEEYKQEVAKLNAMLDPEQFSAAWAAGRAMSIDEAEDYAQNDIAT